MSCPIDVEELEALASGRLTAEQAEAVTRRIAQCPECTQELAWLRAEQALFAERVRHQGAQPDARLDELWADVAATTVNLVNPSQARVHAQQAPPRTQPKTWLHRLIGRLLPGRGSGAWTGLGIGALAAAAAAIVLVLSVPEDTRFGTFIRDAAPSRQGTSAAAALAAVQGELDNAESAHLAALAALDDLYQQRRKHLDPKVAAAYDDQFQLTRAALDRARSQLNRDDFGARAQLLDAYAAHRRALAEVILHFEQIEESNPR